MTHFRVDILLPLSFNKEDGGEKIPQEYFHETYEDLLKISKGVSTNDNLIEGSWIHPDTNVRYDDKSILFTIVVDSEDKMTVHKVSKIKDLINYKEILKRKFKQKQIFMVAIRCCWL